MGRASVDADSILQRKVNMSRGSVGTMPGLDQVLREPREAGKALYVTWFKALVSRWENRPKDVAADFQEQS